MSRDIALYLSDILQNIDDTREFTAGMSYGEFGADKKTINAVVRSIEVIGEAAKHVPGEVRALAPSVPWRNMAGMRRNLSICRQ